MKRGLKVLASLVGLFVIGLPLFAQPSSKSIATFTMEDFDSVGAQDYLCDGESHSWEWNVRASRFITDGFPKQLYQPAAPNSLRQLKKGIDKELTVYGVNTRFDRKGDNWFEIYPEKDGKPYEIPFVGNVSQIDFWMWGQAYNYKVDVMVRDTMGKVHNLPAGSLAFHGWKNIIIKVPGWLQQMSLLSSGPKHMTFVGFRIYSDPEERVDDFKLYIDEIKYTSNSLSYIYDGYELYDVDFGDSTSDSSSNLSSSDDDVVEVSEK